MECELGKADWQCESCCDGCEFVQVVPAPGVKVYPEGRDIPIRVKIQRIKVIKDG